MLGRLCLSLSPFIQLVGPYIADFNEMHVLNPRWPLHARFHNGQTMSVGVCLALATLYYTYRPVAKDAAADPILTAKLYGSMY